MCPTRRAISCSSACGRNDTGGRVRSGRMGCRSNIFWRPLRIASQGPDRLRELASTHVMSGCVPRSNLGKSAAAQARTPGTDRLQGNGSRVRLKPRPTRSGAMAIRYDAGRYTAEGPPHRARGCQTSRQGAPEWRPMKGVQPARRWRLTSASDRWLESGVLATAAMGR
jgi:hypothetical protein